MFDFIDSMIDVGKFVATVLAGLIISILIIALVNAMNNKWDKEECYEIYATDNVILKKCEKYFEVEQ